MNSAALLLCVWAASPSSPARPAAASGAERRPSSVTARSRATGAVESRGAPEAAAPGGAPKATPSGAPVRLAELIAEAETLNETTGIARARLEQASASVRRAIAGLLPSADFTFTYAQRAPTARSGDAIFRAQDAWDNQLDVSMRLLDASQFSEIGAAKSEEDAVEHDGDELVRELRFEVALTYFGVLVTEAALEAARERLELARKTLADTTARVEAGLDPRNAQRRTELELASARLALTRARNAVRQTRLDLGYLVGRPVHEPLVPEVDDVEVSGADLEDAIARRPDVAALQDRIEAANKREREAWFRLVPTLEGRIGVNATNETGFQDSPFSRNFLLVAQWPLYDGGVRYADARENEARARELSLERDQLVRQIHRDIEQSEAELQAAADASEDAEQQLEIAQLNYDEVRDRFDNGLATALEQADAAQQRFDAQVDFAEARFREKQAALRLLRALGLASPVDAGARKSN